MRLILSNEPTWEGGDVYVPCMYRVYMNISTD